MTASSADVIQYHALGGALLLERQGSRPLCGDRLKIAQRLGVCEEQLHLHSNEPGDSASRTYSVAICQSFKLFCEECSAKIDCSCRVYGTCSCVEAQSSSTLPWGAAGDSVRNLCNSCFWALDVGTPPYEEEASFYAYLLEEEEGRKRRWKAPSKVKDKKSRLGKDFISPEDTA